MVKNRELLLTKEQQGAVRARIPGTDNVILFAIKVSERIAEAQLAKAEIYYQRKIHTTNVYYLRQIDEKIEEAKKQERLQILEILQKEYPAIDTWQCWQSLKGGKFNGQTGS